ncbi:MAG: lipocalin family protein [Ignavibacteria bacterium]|nr:lipocalin family protein [Ignavibacteria bacterium]
MKFLRLQKLVLLFLLLVIAAVGCKKDDNPTESSNSPFVGTWKLTKLSAMIGTTPIEMTPEQAGTQMTIIAKDDNSFSMTTVDGTGSKTNTGTWTKTDTQLTLKYSDGTSATFDYTLSGSTFTIKNYPYTHETFGNLLLNLSFTKQ